MELKDIRSESAKRTNSKVRQEDMAEYLGISVPAYCNKEKGRRQFNSDETVLLIKFASDHNISIEEIDIKEN